MIIQLFINSSLLFQGMFVVALPYGVFHGGYWAIAAMVGIAHICCHTGKILVDCLYEEPDEKGYRHKIRFSYKEIAEEVFGKRFGGKLINVAQLIELLMTCILYVVLCGDLLMGAFPTGPIDTRWQLSQQFAMLNRYRTGWLRSVWPELAIFCTLGNFFKPLATINLPKSSTFLGNFCKGVKNSHFSSETIFGQLL